MQGGLSHHTVSMGLGSKGLGL